jgi:RNA polymerase sigma factor (sigma-70 family)
LDVVIIMAITESRALSEAANFLELSPPFIEGEDEGASNRNVSLEPEVGMQEHENMSQELGKRRAALAALYVALPPHASRAFWQALPDPTLPFEVLVRVLRVALALADDRGAQRICAEIIQRLQTLNLLWAQQVLRPYRLAEGEREMLAHDLCADLYEALLRAWYNPQRHFWEENFWHALYFERKHTVHTFMVREGFWIRPATLRGVRIPRSCIVRLEVLREPDQQGSGWEVEDLAAQEMFRLVEDRVLFQAVLQLPEKCKAIVLLIFWEGRTEKEVAHLLAISDRTVRNRLREALRLLRSVLSSEREDLSHA